MVLYNIFTCGGFVNKGIMGGCSQAWLVMAALFFLALVLRRQTDDGILAGTPFNFPGALIGAIAVPFVLILFFQDPRIALFAGLIALAAGGFGGAQIFGGSGGD